MSNALVHPGKVTNSKLLFLQTYSLSLSLATFPTPEPRLVTFTSYVLQPLLSIASNLSSSAPSSALRTEAQLSLGARREGSSRSQGDLDEKLAQWFRQEVMRRDEEHSGGDDRSTHSTYWGSRKHRPGVRGEWRERKKPRITPAWWCHHSCKRKHRLRRGERRRRKKISLVELGFPSHLTVSISREGLINQKLHLEEALLLKIINLFQSFTPGSYWSVL